MKDLKLYLDKLHADAEHCITISQTTLNDKKREVFEMLAATYRKLASDIEAVMATNAILDEERDKRLIGLLGKDDNPAESIDEIAKLLGQARVADRQNPYANFAPPLDRTRHLYFPFPPALRPPQFHHWLVRDANNRQPSRP